MRRTLWILGAAALAAVLVLGISQAGDGGEDAAAPQTAAATIAKIDAPAPLAALYANGPVITPGTVASYEKQIKALKGYPVVVNAWASWCGPCKLEFPYFRDVAQKEGHRIAFLGLNVSDNRGDAEAFLRRQPVPYLSLEDGDARIVQKAGAAGGLPTTIFYDKDGKRAFIHQGGYKDAADLRADIRRYTGA